MCQLHPGSERGAWSRRRFLVVLVGTSGATLAACVGPDQTGLGVQLVSAEEVRELGLVSWQQIRQEMPQSTNQTYRRAAQDISRDILRAAGERPERWEIVVFRSDDINAFALPGNKIGVFEGMFRVANNPPELAAVIGHEIGHNQAEHSVQRVNSQVATDIGVQLVTALLGGGNPEQARMMAAMLGAGVQYGMILPYSRNQELEADRIGLFNMARAGYEPEGAVRLWQNMQRAAGPSPPAFLSTHPGADQRIRQLEALMPEARRLHAAAR